MKNIATMTLGSLFDGIGGWQLAAVNSGIKPIWSSEIEKFPKALTALKFPNTKQLGDITMIKGDEIEPVDIICAGSPCQDLSVAKGKRKGLKGSSSGLFVHAIRIIREMRSATGGTYPKIFVWENVPGAFSSNKGADFQAVLRYITQSKIPMPRLNKWASAGLVRSRQCDVAWRVLDAQYFGVAQRRKRIFLIADFRTEMRCPAEILFEPYGVPRDTKASQRTKKNITRYAKENTRGAGEKVALYDPSHRADVIRHIEAVVPTIGHRAGTGGNNLPIVAYGIAGNIIGRQGNNGGNGAGVQEEISYTIDTTGSHAVAFAAKGFSNYEDNSKVVSTLTARNMKISGENLIAQSGVRRLTPRECERLQGLPDDYTLIDDKSCSDSARYKALGNGMAQPCADYVIRRIVEAIKNGSI